jgi:hypothetical protein
MTKNEDVSVDNDSTPKEKVVPTVSEEEKLWLGDLVHWRNPFVSAAVLVMIWAVFILIYYYEFTAVTLVGRVIQLMLLVGAVSWALKTFLKTEILAVHIGNMTLTTRKDLFREIRDVIVSFFDGLLPLVLIKDPLKSLGFIVVLQIVCVIGKYFGGFTLLFVATNIAMIVPVVYEKFKTQIDDAVAQSGKKAQEVVKQVEAKLPPQVKSILKKLE